MAGPRDAADVSPTIGAEVEPDLESLRQERICLFEEGSQHDEKHMKILKDLHARHGEIMRESMRVEDFTEVKSREELVKFTEWHVGDACWTSLSREERLEMMRLLLAEWDRRATFSFVVLSQSPGSRLR